MKHITYTMMVFYHQLLPRYDLQPIRCINCSRMIGKMRYDELIITNSAGLPIEKLPPAMGYFEHQCHSCKALYKILFN